jgi:outer membrane protein assembly factor BamA
VDTKKNTIIDSLNYIFPSFGLQQVVINNYSKALLKKGEPFTVEKISAEINRLLTDFRNNGYFQITRNDIYADVDTVNKALFDPSLSDFERILLLAQSRNKRPSINVLMRLRPKSDSSDILVYDSTKLKQYYIGNITVYSDYNFLANSTDSPQVRYLRDSSLIIKYNSKKYRSSFIAGNIFLRKNDLYRENEYNRTVNNLNQLGTWQVVNVVPTIDSLQPDSLRRVDLAFYLTPVKKYSFSANVESSLSTNVIAATGAGNILGFLGNVSLTDRNVARQGIRMVHSIRGGIEFNLKQNGVQNSRELGYSNNVSIPRFMPPFRFLLPKNTLVRSSTVNSNISSLNRVGFFNLASLNLGLGYEWKRKPNTTSIWKPLTIDYTNLYNASDSFIKATDENVFLRNSFQTSLVIGQSYGYGVQFISKRNPNRITTLKVNLEESGLIFGTLKKMINQDGFLKNLREFVKADVEVKHFMNFNKSALVFRFFTGVGSPVRGDSGIPFFKQYFAGGPNSMRAWPIRTLGQGGAPFPPYQPGASRFNDRVGDIQLEGNVEYRYDITPLFNNVLTLKGALFMDAGNVWAIRRDKTITVGDDPKVFQFKNLYKQLAVGLGTGLRFDFNYFLVRFDFGFRFKKPDVAANDGWQIPSINIKNVFGANGREWRYENFNFTFGINYAF